MTSPTHLNGGKVAASITMLFTVVALKLSPNSLLEQILMFIILYPAVMAICSVGSRICDCDIGLQQIPLLNYYGMLTCSIAHMNNAVHRKYPMHCISVYLKYLLPPIIVLSLAYIRTKSIIILGVCILLLAALTGVLSHLYMDGLTVSGINRTKDKTVFFGSKSNTVFKIKCKMFLLFPILSFKGVHIPRDERITHSAYETLIFKNALEVNRFVRKITFYILIIDLNRILF